MPDLMDFDEWMAYGIGAGWCGPPVCEIHDGLPTTAAEDREYEDGGDPCIHVVRMYGDAAVKAGVEANHSPSVWRNSYTRSES